MMSNNLETHLTSPPTPLFKKETQPIGDVEAEKKCDNEPLDEIMKALEKYDIAKEFISIVALGIMAEHEKEKMQRKIEELNKTQYPISPF